MSRRYPIPGLEKHPDLIRRLEHELSKICKDCERAQVYRKIADLVRRREPQT